MTDLTPVATLSPVPQLETTDRALAGTGNPMNRQAQALLNRDAFRAQQIAANAVAAAAAADDVVALRQDVADDTDPAKGSGLVGYKSRTAAARLDDEISVANYGTDQSAIELAVSDAVAGQVALYWPDGDFTSTGNIPGLHSVRHRGPGRIVRGGSTFYPDPGHGQTNSLYCDPSAGADTNDGLDAANGTATRAQLFNYCRNYGGSSPASWDLYFGAGTTQERFDTAGFTAAGGVNIYGPDVAGGAPTAILDGNVNTIAPSIIGPYGIWNIYDITFQNYSGHCVVSNPFTVCSYYNCRGTGGTQAGVNFEANSRGYLYGGLYSGNVWGARFYSQVTGSIRTDPRTLSSAQFNSNSNYGFQIRENCNVRADDFICDGNTLAALSVENSRVHLVNATLDNSPIGVLSNRGATWLDDATTYGTGIVVPYVERSGALELGGASRLTPSITAFTSAVAVTGTTSKTTVHSITIPARYLNSNQKIIKVRGFGNWTVTGAATIGIEFGASALTSVTTSSSGSASFNVEFRVVGRGSGSQMILGILTVHNGVGQVVRVARTVSNAAELSLNLFVTLANSGDSVTFDEVEFEYLG